MCICLCLPVGWSPAKVYPWEWSSDWRRRCLDTVCSLRLVTCSAVKRVVSDTSVTATVCPLRHWYRLQWHVFALTRFSPQCHTTLWCLRQHRVLWCRLHKVLCCKHYVWICLSGQFSAALLDGNSSVVAVFFCSGSDWFESSDAVLRWC